jgi:ubiquitin-protein ligase
MFRYRLELPNGQPADPPQFSAATQMWRPGEPVFVRPGTILRVLEVRPAAREDAEPVLVVRPD